MNDSYLHEFPRGEALPSQSPIFWAEHKDRFLRQLMIRDIEAQFGRTIIVYYTDCSAPLPSIDGTDDQFLLELLDDVDPEKPVDLIIETNGGSTDGTEKLVAILRGLKDLRVVVPRRAKSNGTLLALAANEIVMGPSSELGPIDPSLSMIGMPPVPAQFIVSAADAQKPVDPILYEAAKNAIAQSVKLASSLLGTGMCKDDPKKAKELVKHLATRDRYHSHGSVIDSAEAKALGLNVDVRSHDDPYWRWIWLLRCLYESDTVSRGYWKIFEGRRISNAIYPPPAAPSAFGQTTDSA